MAREEQCLRSRLRRLQGLYRVALRLRLQAQELHCSSEETQALEGLACLDGMIRDVVDGICRIMVYKSRGGRLDFIDGSTLSSASGWAVIAISDDSD